MDFAEYDRLEEESSLLHWWPRTKDSGVPVPRTVVVEVEHDTLLGILDGAPLPAAVGRVIKEAGKLLGYPLFLRTDQASAKHDWQNGSFVSNEESLFQHIVNVVEFNVMASIIGLPMKAIVLREFLELDTRFTAFHGNMPVAAERRY